MSFLLSSFFAAPVSSRMGLPLHWVSSPSASSVGALLSWAPAVLGLFHAEVVSARLNLSHGTIDVTRVYVPWFFVLSQQRFGVTDIKALGASQLSGLGQTVLYLLGKSVLRERERERPSFDLPCILATAILDSFCLFYLPNTSKEHPGLISFGSPCSPRDSQESSPTQQFKSINSSALSFLHSPTLTSIHDHRKNHSLD